VRSVGGWGGGGVVWGGDTQYLHACIRQEDVCTHIHTDWRLSTLCLCQCEGGGGTCGSDDFLLSNAQSNKEGVLV